MGKSEPSVNHPVVSHWTAVLCEVRKGIGDGSVVTRTGVANNSSSSPSTNSGDSHLPAIPVPEDLVTRGSYVLYGQPHSSAHSPPPPNNTHTVTAQESLKSDRRGSRVGLLRMVEAPTLGCLCWGLTPA